MINKTLNYQFQVDKWSINEESQFADHAYSLEILWRGSVPRKVLLKQVAKRSAVQTNNFANCIFFAAVANVTSKYSIDNKYLYHFIFVTLYFADCISQHIKSYKSIFKSIEIQKVCGRKKRMARDTKRTRVHFYTLNSPFSALLPLTIGFTK